MKITGRVQGVFFRAEAKEVADKLGLTGWACNKNDGSVEILAEGARDRLDVFLKWCQKGPERAHVEKVNAEWEKADSSYQGFEVR